MTALCTLSAGGTTGPVPLNVAVVDYCRRRTTLTRTEARATTTQDHRTFPPSARRQGPGSGGSVHGHAAISFRRHSHGDGTMTAPADGDTAANDYRTPKPDKRTWKPLFYFATRTPSSLFSKPSTFIARTLYLSHSTRELCDAVSADARSHRAPQSRAVDVTGQLGQAGREGGRTESTKS